MMCKYFIFQADIRGLAQHGYVNTFGEPYVYNYHLDDVDDLNRQIEKAINTPIDPL